MIIKLAGNGIRTHDLSIVKRYTQPLHYRGSDAVEWILICHKHSRNKECGLAEIDRTHKRKVVSSSPGSANVL